MTTSAVLNSAWVSASASRQTSPTAPLFPSFVPLRVPNAQTFIVGVQTTSPPSVSYLNPQCAPDMFFSAYTPPPDLKYV